MKNLKLSLAQTIDYNNLSLSPNSYDYRTSYLGAAVDSIFVLIGYFFKFFFTYFIELIFFSVWNNKIKDKNIPKTVFRVNLFTHPLFTFIVWSLNNFQIIDITYKNPLAVCYLIFFEVIIVFIEWKLYCFALPYSRKQLFWLSLLSNTASFFVGNIWIFNY
jgi:hypothetical protein